jgi:selenide,water dikinase
VPGKLVLVGGGHAHVLVLRALASRPAPGVQTTVVVDRPDAVYSGMVPGFVAGRYAAGELTIDVAALAQRADAAVVVSPATRIDPVVRRIELADAPPLAYDVAALDVGSTASGLGLPGVAGHTLATRPIGRFVEAVDALLARARRRGRCQLAVVGAGAGGVELACAFRARLAREGVADAAVTLIEAGPRVLPGAAERVARRAAAALAARGVALRTGARVAGVEASGDEKRLLLEGGRDDLACDEVVWVSGAAPPALIADSPLPHDAAGFVRVRATLAVEGHDDLFAAGDCAAFAPPLPKAGVYAVRQGPVLAHNLRAALAGGALRRYRPQRDFLTLLDLGDGTAIGGKWGLAFEGRAVLALKRHIDRGFVARFRP